MAGHTPGPWTVIAEQHPSGASRVQAGPFEILLTSRTGATADVWTANARLIAAAPELLAALRGLARGAPAYPCFCNVATGHATAHTHRCVAAVAAIAKAEAR